MVPKVVEMGGKCPICLEIAFGHPRFGTFSHKIAAKKIRPLFCCCGSMVSPRPGPDPSPHLGVGAPERAIYGKGTECITLLQRAEEGEGKGVRGVHIHTKTTRGAGFDGKVGKHHMVGGSPDPPPPQSGGS